MFRFIFILLCLGWVTGHAEAQNSMAALFEERSYDFGPVPRGAKRVHPFTVTNTTDKPLRILSIRIPCNCVSARATEKEIAPGESTTVVAELDTRRFAGSMTKYCYVLFDQPREEVQLVVLAFSHEGLFLEPETFAFGKVKKGATLEKSVTISSADLQGADAMKTTPQSAFVEAHMEAIAGGTGNTSYRVTARLRPDLPVGDWYCTIALQSNDRRVAPIQIPLTVTIEP